MKNGSFKCSVIFFATFFSSHVYAKQISSADVQLATAVFTENKGQVTDQYHKPRPDIDFKLQSNGMTMFVGDAQIHYMWYQSNKKEKSKSERITDGARGELNSAPAVWNTYRMDVVLIGANKNAELVTEDRQADYENYYVPNREDAITAYSYKKITYKNIYPNIDWEIASPNPSQGGEAVTQGCKYNFIVHPGGDYRNIKIQYNGAASIALKDGALIASTPIGSITENVPYTYDAVTKKEIKSNFILNNNILTYSIALPPGSGEGMAGQDGTFIIDPLLSWATYYGGSDLEFAWGLCTDNNGNVYMTGQSKSTSNIATSGSFQSSYIGSSTNGDGFIVKFNSQGVRQWATYYDDLDPADICSDGGNGIYICGGIGIGGMATLGSFQTSLNGTEDGYLVKFDTSGVRQWATYYGGNNQDHFQAICYEGGHIYGGGRTTSTTVMYTTGAHLATPSEGFFVKFNTAGVRQYGSFFPGTVHVICPDRLGNFYIGGFTSSTTGVATTGAFQTLPGDAFINKFTNAGNRVWGTYYGDNGYAYWVSSIACRGTDVYFSGCAQSSPGIATAGSHQPTHGGGNGDGYLAKFDGSGNRQWATYYGGTSSDCIEGIAFGADGLLYCTGHSGSNNNIASAGAYKTSVSGFSDAFLAAFNTNGVRQWGTYYGGPDIETAILYNINYTRLACSNKGSIYISSYTRSTSGIATTGSYQPTYGGGLQDGYVVQFYADTSVFVMAPFTDTLLCIGDSLHLQYGVTQNFRSGNSFTLELSNAIGSFASPTTLATVTANTAGTFNTVIPSVPAGTGYRVRVRASAPADTSEDNGINIKVRPNPTTPTATANSPICAGQTLNLSSSNSSTGVVWSWAGPNSFTAATQNASIPNVQTNATGDYYVTANLNGCKRKDTVSVTVNPSPSKPNATSNSPICSGQTLNLFATTTTGGVSWNWAGPGGFNTSAQNPTIPNAQTSNAGSYMVTATLGNCSSADTEVVVINQGPAINIYPSPNDTICQGGSVTLVAVPISAGTGPTFQWYKNSNPIGGATNTSYSTTPNNGDVYYCQMTPGTGTSCTGAVSSNSITMTVLPVTTPSVSISGPAGAQDPYNLLTFHATGTGGGSSPKYQWLRSGHQLIQGATGDTWSTQGLYLSQHDTICVILTSSDICAVPKSDTACMAVNILTGVEDINKNTTIQLYPNPNDGRFTIEAKSIGSREVTIEIVNAVGQTVHTQKLSTTKGILHETISTTNLAAGMYLLKLHDGDAVATLRLVVRY